MNTTQAATVPSVRGSNPTGQDLQKESSLTQQPTVARAPVLERTYTDVDRFMPAGSITNEAYHALPDSEKREYRRDAVNDCYRKGGIRRGEW